MPNFGINRPPTVSPIRSSKCWGCKVKLPDKSRHPVSLRVPWPGNVKQARDRAAELQREVDAMKLDASLAWLGEKSAETLKIKLGLKPLERDDAIRPIFTEPTTWWEARSAWIATYPVRTPVEGKIHDPDLTRKGYEGKTRLFCRWADEAGLKFRAKSATVVTHLYLRARQAGGNASSKGGVSLGSLDHDVRVLNTWFAWLHRRGWYDRIDKDSVFEDPVWNADEPAEVNFIPPWRLDLATLEKMHAGRLEDETAFAAWRLYVLVRGLGCRPKEAYTLSWDTVHLDEGLVIFKDTKEEKLKSKRRRGSGRSRRSVRDRKVPIVWQWVRDALAEMKALGAPRGTAVAVNSDGVHHAGSGQASNALGRRFRAIGVYREGYNLKACQRAGLVHLERVLPPWVVARLAGHSLDIHMAHYSTNDGHLAAPQAEHLGRFDTLSPAGKAIVAKYRRSGLVDELLRQGEL